MNFAMVHTRKSRVEMKNEYGGPPLEKRALIKSQVGRLRFFLLIENNSIAGLLRWGSRYITLYGSGHACPSHSRNAKMKKMREQNERELVGSRLPIQGL